MCTYFAMTNHPRVQELDQIRPGHVQNVAAKDTKMLLV